MSNEHAPPDPGSAPRRRLVAWRGPDPQRIDAAALVLFGDRLHAAGASVATDFSLTYQLTTVAGWITERLEVRVTLEHGRRELLLVRDAAGAWSSMRTSASDGDGVVDRRVRCVRVSITPTSAAPSTATSGCVR